MPLATYPIDRFYDEVFEDAGRPRRQCAHFVQRLAAISQNELTNRQVTAEMNLREMGITFAVYGHEAGVEKVWPCDLLPRIIDRQEWITIERGLKQRVRALNMFINDMYNEQQILHDKVVPGELVLKGANFRAACIGHRPRQGVWCHVSGVDLVRNHDGQIYVLEDNLRCPSGVSYVLENREVMKRTFPHIFQGMSVAAIDDYPERLLETLLDCAPAGVSRPTTVVLTPGVYNSAYFEHTFLAQQMGVELVQGSDLVVADGFVWLRTTRGLQKVDVIYSRINDDFLDPLCFRPDSCLGVPGLMDVYRSGRVTIANAPGCGIADDKAVYAYVPQIIEYYLGEKPLLPNVPTYVCAEPDQCEYVLSHLDQLVIKPTNESGGYGIVLGPRASESQLAECAAAIRSNPRNYVAQPMLTLSTVPTIAGDQLKPRHVDLRPFVLSGRDIFVLPGGLTRVALQEGSMVVNSSQGGGSKDTWVLT